MHAGMLVQAGGDAVVSLLVYTWAALFGVESFEGLEEELLGEAGDLLLGLVKGLGKLFEDGTLGTVFTV